MLRLDQIDLDGVVQGRARQRPDEPGWFLDAATGAVQQVSPDGSVVEGPQPGRWEFIHPTGMGGRVVYRDMADFVDLLTDSHARESLDRALAGRLPFGDQREAARRFDAMLRRFPDLQPVWTAFRAARAYRAALRWLAEMGYVDQAEADAAARSYPDPELPPLGRRIDAEAIARAVAADLRTVYGERLQQVLLFGSYARGTADEESDIDLLVVLDPMDSPYVEALAMDDVLWRHTYDNDVTVSAIAVSAPRYRDAATPFLSNVTREGRLVS